MNTNNNRRPLNSFTRHVIWPKTKFTFSDLIKFNGIDAQSKTGGMHIMTLRNRLIRALAEKNIFFIEKRENSGHSARGRKSMVYATKALKSLLDANKSRADAKAAKINAAKNSIEINIENFLPESIPVTQKIEELVTS
jgi:hypothetical protein